MDYQTLINWAITLGVGVIGWFAKALWAAAGDLRTDLAKLREELPKTYITKDDFKDAVQELKSLLVAIDTKLDRKVDRQ